MSILPAVAGGADHSLGKTMHQKNENRWLRIGGLLLIYLIAVALGYLVGQPRNPELVKRTAEYSKQYLGTVWRVVSFADQKTAEGHTIRLFCLASATEPGRDVVLSILQEGPYWKAPTQKLDWSRIKPGQLITFGLRPNFAGEDWWEQAYLIPEPATP